MRKRTFILTIAVVILVISYFSLIHGNFEPLIINDLESLLIEVDTLIKAEQVPDISTSTDSSTSTPTNSLNLE